MWLRTSIVCLTLANAVQHVAAQTVEPMISWNDIWDAQFNILIGVISGVSVLLLLLCLGCCGCGYFCRRMGYNEGLKDGQQVQYDQTGALQQQQQQQQQQAQQQQAMQMQAAQTAQPPVVYQQPTPAPVAAPQQPVYVSRPPPPREDPYSRSSSSVYYNNESRSRPVVRTYSSRPDYYR